MCLIIHIFFLKRRDSLFLTKIKDVKKYGRNLKKYENNVNS